MCVYMHIVIFEAFNLLYERPRACWSMLYFFLVCLFVFMACICQVHQNGCYLYLVMLPGLLFPDSSKKQIISSGPWHLATARDKLYFSTLGSDITTAPGVLGLQQGQVMESKEEIKKPPHHSGEGLV